MVTNIVTIFEHNLGAWAPREVPPVANPSECKGGEGDFLSPINCIYMKARLELFIDSIKTLSL